MKTYLFCFALFVNLFQLGAGVLLSNRYRSQFGNFLAKDKNSDWVLSAKEVENYHLGDVCSLLEADEGVPVANSGLFKNNNLLESLRAVVTEIISKIEVESRDAVNMEAESRTANAIFGKSGIPPLSLLVTEINKQYEANCEKQVTLKKFLNNLNPILESEYPGVQIQVVALFRSISFHTSKGRSDKLTLDGFLSFMAEIPTEKEILPSLIQTAFKEYMLGMINSKPDDVLTPDELEDFLRIHCAMEGNLVENFEYFAKEIDPAGNGDVDVEKVRKKWATMNLVSCFNTLVKP